MRELALVLSLITVGLGTAEAQTITSLDPPLIAASYPFSTLTLKVNGSDFATGAVVQWNGSPLATTFVSATQLTASVPSTLLRSPGTATVTVLSGGSISNSATFTIPPRDPTITSTNPASAIAGGVGFTLTITGTGFVPGSTVVFGNAALGSNALAVTFVSATQLTAFVPASLIASPGSSNVIAVFNPGFSGEGASDFYPFTIYPAGVNISSLDPSSLRAGYPFPTLPMTVNGSGFV